MFGKIGQPLFGSWSIKVTLFYLAFLIYLFFLLDKRLAGFYRFDDDYAKGTISISLGKNNTKEDAEKIAAALVKIVG